MNWGHKLTIGFICFVIFMIGMVTISIRADYSLVDENYYEEEIAYQSKIDRLTNGESWKNTISLVQGNDFLNIYFEEANLINQGKVYFFRPSNDDLDFNLPLVENYNLPTQKLAPGKWEVQFTWNYDGKSYQKNSIIYIGV
jgi:hypothetical protein